MHKTLKEKIRQRLISEHKTLFSRDTTQEAELKGIISRMLEEYASHDHINISEEEKNKIIGEVTDMFLGLGPLEAFLKDPEVTEIMINGPKKIYVEKRGRKELTAATFDSEEQLTYLMYKILTPTRRRVDESYPYTDLSLKDGSRVNIIIPPLSLDGTVITIRKFSKVINSVDDLVNLDTLDRKVADFLIACIKAKVNIIFSGATGVGKTTTLNVLSSCIANDERIVTIEDTAELNLEQEHVVRLEARQPNIEGKGEITIRDLFRNSLRMRPDRIIIGEIRGTEALDMLQAICSGHRGAMAIIHASSPQDVIYRMETMILTSGVPITMEAIHRQIITAINLIVQQEHMLDGTRKVTRVTQVNGLKDNEVILEDIFVYETEVMNAENRLQGKWKATGVVPVFYPLFKKEGVELSTDIFNND